MNINLRIKEVRKTLSLSQEEFGSRLGITGGGVSKIEKGARNVTDQMVLSICREFNVSKIWLIEGHGEMFESDDMEFARAVDRVMFGESDFARRVFKLFGKLSLEEWNKLEEIACSLVDDKKKEADE
ncbi:MAG: helix-turn-helix domain-containing protein [Acutalibacteraceae bacterium]